MKRKEIVQEYIQLKNDLRVRNENRKEGNLLKEKEREEQFKPIITATEETAKKITSAISRTEETPYEYYTKLGKNKDTYYSIYRINEGTFRLGDSEIVIDDKNNIHVKDQIFNYSRGLWDLIMLNKPSDGEYTDEDLLRYLELIKLVDLINNPRENKGNPKGTLKYRFLAGILGLKRKRQVPDDEEEEESDTDEPKHKKENSEKIGEGVILPGDINGLIQRLQLVCGERYAGNIGATTPEIIAILDELLRRKHITKSEYNVVCKRLGC